MVKLNNVVRVNTTNVKDFFVKWFVFLKPFHNLTNKEIDVMATFLKYRYELLSKSDDPNLPNLIDDVVMSEGIKAKVRADCKLSKAYFGALMSQLKRSSVFMDKKINPKFIPNMEVGDKSFNLLFYFEIGDEEINNKKGKQKSKD